MTGHSTRKTREKRFSGAGNDKRRKITGAGHENVLPQMVASNEKDYKCSICVNNR